MELIEALHEAGIDFVATLPSSSLTQLQQSLAKDQRFKVVFVSNEGEGVGICAGAWLGGKKPLLLMENSGLPVIPYSVLRLSAAYGIPTLLFLDYRGDMGDANWWAVPFGWSTEPLLTTLRIPYTLVEDMNQLKKAIPKMWKTAQHSKYLSAIVLRYGTQLV